MAFVSGHITAGAAATLVFTPQSTVPIMVTATAPGVFFGGPGVTISIGLSVATAGLSVAVAATLPSPCGICLASGRGPLATG